LTEEKDRWTEIRIYYEHKPFVTISRWDLEKIDALRDVIDALKTAQRLADDIHTILR